MSKFQPLSSYEKGLGNEYRLLPLRFTELDADNYVLSNFVGEHQVVSRARTHEFLRHQLPNSTPEYLALKGKHFLIDEDSNVAIDLLALKARTKFERMSNFTGLHLFVVTLRCEHSCPYCQVSRQNDDKREFDMSVETAEKSLDLVFRSPNPNIKIEFQGGEPLLNFPMVQHVVRGALERNTSAKRNLGFVIATNLAVVTDDILELLSRTFHSHLDIS